MTRSLKAAGGASDTEYVPAYDRRDWLDNKSDDQIDKALARQVIETTSPFLPGELAALSVLDVGSGNGGSAIELAKVFRRVVGIELSNQRVRRGQESAERAGMENVEFRCQSVYELNDIEEFDLVVMDNVLEHFDNQPLALKNASNALRPGGAIYLLVPNRLWPVEVHYRLPFLSYLPLRAANWYLRLSGRGKDYTDASYAPTFFRLKKLLQRRSELAYQFVLPTNLSLTRGGSAWHYRLGAKAIKRFPTLWAISKAFLVVATKDRATSP